MWLHTSTISGFRFRLTISADIEILQSVSPRSNTAFQSTSFWPYSTFKEWTGLTLLMRLADRPTTGTVPWHRQHARSRRSEAVRPLRIVVACAVEQCGGATRENIFLPFGRRGCRLSAQNRCVVPNWPSASTKNKPGLPLAWQVTSLPLLLHTASSPHSRPFLSVPYQYIDRVLSIEIAGH